MSVKPKHPKKCVKCGKEYIGFYNQKICFKCAVEEKQRRKQIFNCSNCGRHSRHLINGLCYFCKKISRKNPEEPEKKHRHCASEIETLKPKCPKCESTRRELKETLNSMMVICSECGAILAKV